MGRGLGRSLSHHRAVSRVRPNCSGLCPVFFKTTKDGDGTAYQGNLYHLSEVIERGLAMTLSSSLTTRGCIPSGPVGLCMSNVP